MISSLLNFLSDTTLQIRAGRITFSLPARRLYRIAPYNEPMGTYVYAAPLEVYTRGGLGVTVTKNYNIGDDVIYIEGADNNESSGLLYGVIIGTIPVGVSCIDRKIISENVSESFNDYDPTSITDNLGVAATEEVANALQLMDVLGYNGFDTLNSVEDLPGDYNISGSDSAIQLDDISVNLSAGKAKIRLNGVYDMLDVSSTLFRKVSAGSFEQLYLINDNFTHLLLQGLSVGDCYTKEAKPVFRYAEELSNYVYGKKRAMLSDDGLEISSIDQTLDGRVSISGTNGVKLSKTVRTKNIVIPHNSPVKYDENAIITSEQDLPEIAKNKELWEIQSTEADPTPNILNIPSEGESRTEAEGVGNFYDGISPEGVEYVKAEASIETLPSGGILIRDAWGSEIRLEGGNIQISAANNLTLIGGRDLLGICNGVTAINAGEAVQIGAAKRSVSIQGEKGIELCAKTGDIRTLGESLSVETSKMNADTDVTRLKSKNTVIGGDRIVLNATELIAHGDVASISGSTSGLVLSNGAVLGANSIVVNGSLAVRRGGLSISGIPTVDGDSVNVNTSRATCSLSVDGSISTSGAIAAAQQIITADGVYADSFGAKNSDVGKLRNAPKKVKISSIDPLDYNITGNVETIKTIMTYFKELKNKALFTLASKAFAIWQPLFSKLQGKTKLPVAVSKDKNYIYPGKSFWEKDGMIVADSIGSDEEISLAGVGSLLLNNPNVEDGQK